MTEARMTCCNSTLENHVGKQQELNVLEYSEPSAPTVMEVTACSPVAVKISEFASCSSDGG
jgi:hypothetical protein